MMLQEQLVTRLMNLLNWADKPGDSLIPQEFAKGQFTIVVRIIMQVCEPHPLWNGPKLQSSLLMHRFR